jgi:catechol O-methyltransferase
MSQSKVTIWSAVFAAGGALAFKFLPGRWAVAGAGVLSLLALHELTGRPIPFLRWSFIRLILALPKLLKGDWQVGDGREEACLKHVQQTVPRGDPDAVLKAIDHFAYQSSFLINVGDVKGKILDEIVRKKNPMVAVELGSYIGYSAVLIARRLPDEGHLFCIEVFKPNAEIVKKMVAHAGLADKVTVVTGAIGDDGETVSRLINDHGFKPGYVDLCFIDHDKNHYLADLRRMMQQKWFKEGSVVVADNMVFPGAPEYAAYMKSADGIEHWESKEHDSFVEYQSLMKDKMLVSTYVKK